MGLFFVYILKSSACLAVFYLFYRLLLSRETFHRFNRFALLGTLLFSCLLPLIEVSVQQQTEVHQTMMSLEQWLLLADAMNTAEVQAPEVTVTWIQLALLLYLTGILFFAFRHIYSLSRMVLLLKSGRRERLNNYVAAQKKIELIIHNKEIAPFSWMKYVVISQKDLEENGREILIHELAHIRNRHSLDLLVADICIFFQWFNPAAWLLKQELQNIHEYEADETVIKEGINAKQYQLLLIKKAVGTRLYSMANSFNHSKLKKRITMMLKEKSSPWARLKYLYVLPLAAVAVTAFARPEVSRQAEEISRMSDALGREQVDLLFSRLHDISAVKVNDLAAIVETKEAESIGTVLEVPATKALPGDTAKVKVTVKAYGQVKDPIFQMVEQMPEFPGGMSAFIKYLQENMRYPEAAKKAGIQGRVTVRFVVDKDGSIKNPEILRSVAKELDAEALRLITASPKWQPGKQKGEPVAVEFTVPVVFRLDGKNAEVDGVVISREEDSKQAIPLRLNGGQDKMMIRTPNGVEPLYIIDGKEASSSVMGAIRPDAIESMSVLKDDAAVQVYGEKGKNGVVLITLKSGGPTVVGVPSLGQSTSVKFTTTKSVSGKSIGVRGMGGLSVEGNDADMLDVVVYIDGIKVGFGNQINDLIPADQIESISVKKNASVENGSPKKGGEIHITTKKNDKGSENISVKGILKIEGDKKESPGASVIVSY